MKSNAFDFAMNVESFTSKLSKVADTFSHDGNGIFDQMAAKDEYLRTDSLRAEAPPPPTACRSTTPPRNRNAQHTDYDNGVIIQNESEIYSNDPVKCPPLDSNLESSSTSSKVGADDGSTIPRSNKSKNLLSVVAALVAEDEAEQEGSSISITQSDTYLSDNNNNKMSARDAIRERTNLMESTRTDNSRGSRLAFDFRDDDDDDDSVVEEDDFILDIVRKKDLGSFKKIGKKEQQLMPGEACEEGNATKVVETNNYVADIESLVDNSQRKKKGNIFEAVGSSIAARWKGMVPFKATKSSSGGCSDASCTSISTVVSTSASVAAAGQSEEMNISVVSASCLLEEDLAELERFTQESRKSKMWKNLLKLFSHRHFLFIAFTVVLGWATYFWGKKNVEDDGVD